MLTNDLTDPVWPEPERGPQTTSPQSDAAELLDESGGVVAPARIESEVDPDLDPDLDASDDPDQDSNTDTRFDEAALGDDALEERVDLDEASEPRTAPARFEINETLARWIGIGIAIICSIFVFIQMQPQLLFSDTTPSGGDMGAHVWGPAFMRDNLLTSGRLTGWTPDWYAGFPAYHYYMVVPALAIIAMNAGLNPLIGIPLAIAALSFSFALARSFPSLKALAFSAGGLAAVLLIGMPYGTAFKLVSVAGLVFFPLAAYLMGRLTSCPRPVPEFLAFAALLFLFDTNFTIYGGNIASTLAGEFAFSLSLCLSLVVIGLAVRGMDDSKWRASAAAVIALVALTHIIPLFFAIVALVLLVVLDSDLPRTWALAAAITLALVPLTLAEGTSFLVQAAAFGSFVVVLGAIILAEPRVTDRAKWLLVAGPTAAAISAFWLLPFYLRSDFFNDMGWERLEEVGPALLTTPMKAALPVAAVGAALSFAIRDRIGMLFTILAVTFAGAVANLPHGKLWNARLLPFYYLSVYMLVAVAIGLVARFAAIAISERFDEPNRPVMAASSVVGLLATLVVIGIPLRILPGGVDQEDGTYSFFGAESQAGSFIPSWVNWNYSGYEEKRSYREYRGVVSTMGEIGDDNGCGRAMWEYDRELDRYGTPMALMLLPHWTDGCIGSMEGLYFESSASTPFHFLNQSMLSISPSRAQRGLPYQSFDIDRGVAQLQNVGVRYYMALSDEAIAAASEHPDLTQVGVAEPFTIFEVSGYEMVEGLATEPVVVSGRSMVDAGEEPSRFDYGFLGEAVQYYNDPNRFAALPAEDGPESWERVSSLLADDGRAIEPVAVSDIDVTTDTISFSVDEVGSPVLVKTSYFPNWQVDGADGPYRVGPNMMVVVPTSTDVRLSYGYTGAEYSGYLITLLGFVSLAALTVTQRRRIGAAFSATSAKLVGDPVVDTTEPEWGSDTDLPTDSLSASDMAPSDVVSTDVVSTDVVSTDVVSTDVVSTDMASTDVASTDVASPAGLADVDDAITGSAPVIDAESAAEAASALDEAAELDQLPDASPSPLSDGPPSPLPDGPPSPLPDGPPSPLPDAPPSLRDELRAELDSDDT